MNKIYPDFLKTINSEKYFNVTSAIFAAEDWLNNNWLIPVEDTVTDAIVTVEVYDRSNTCGFKTRYRKSNQYEHEEENHEMPLNSTTKCVLLVLADVARDIRVDNGDTITLTFSEGGTFRENDIRTSVKNAIRAFTDWMYKFNRIIDLMDGLIDGIRVPAPVLNTYLFSHLAQCTNSVGGRYLLRALFKELLGANAPQPEDARAESHLQLRTYFSDIDSAMGLNGKLGVDFLLEKIQRPLTTDESVKLKELNRFINKLRDAQLRREAQRNNK